MKTRMGRRKRSKEEEEKQENKEEEKEEQQGGRGKGERMEEYTESMSVTPWLKVKPYKAEFFKRR